MTTLRELLTIAAEVWRRLPSYVRHLAATFVTAALSGGATALTAIAVDPTHFNAHELRHVGWVFLAGVLIGIANWVREQPWKTADRFVPISDIRR